MSPDAEPFATAEYGIKHGSIGANKSSCKYCESNCVAGSVLGASATCTPLSPIGKILTQCHCNKAVLSKSRKDIYAQGSHGTFHIKFSDQFGLDFET
jgi:hypothetical protein